MKNSKKLFDSLKGKMKKPISETKLKSIASGLKQSDLKDEKQIRQLVNQLSTLANVQLSDQKVNEIVHYIKSNNISSANVGQLMKMWNNK